MAKEKEAEAAPALTDTQRIEQLESGQGFLRILVIALGALSVILLTMVITAIFVLPAQNSARGTPLSAERAAELDAALQENTKTFARLEEAVRRMEEVQATYVQTMDQLGVIDRTRQTEAMLDILLQQHRDYREVVKALRTGMSDLARMVPGSRIWLLEYTERLNATLQASAQREEQLLQFKKSLEPEPEAED